MGLEIEIPKNWKIAELKNVCQAVTGTTPPKSDPKNYGNDIPFVKPPQLFDKPVHDAPEKLSLKGAKLARVLPPNSVMVTCIGNLGRTAINSVQVAFNQQINALIPSDEVNSKFLFYQTQSWYFRKQLDELSSATTVAIVNKGKFETIEIAIPPPHAQAPIVEKIEELFSELDKGIENLKTAQQQLKAYRQAVLKWAFEGKLTNDNVKDGELPEGWEWKELGQLMESVKNGYSKKPDENGEFKILRISSVRPNSLNINDVRYLKKSLGEQDSIKENDLLFTRYNGSIDFVGVCARVSKLNEKIYYPDKLIRCRILIKEPYHSAYITYAANSHISRQFVLSKIKTTAGQTGISGGEIKQVPIPLAPKKEQQLIVEEIESRLSVCDKMEETISTSLQQAEALRQSILKRAFEGKLVGKII